MPGSLAPSVYKFPIYRMPGSDGLGCRVSQAQDTQAVPSEFHVCARTQRRARISCAEFLDRPEAILKPNSRTEQAASQGIHQTCKGVGSESSHLSSPQFP